MNVAPGVAASDAVTLAQLQAATAAVTSSATPTDDTELAALRALVIRLEARIAQLERLVSVAAPVE
jgi:hypothetical protein